MPNRNYCFTMCLRPSDWPAIRWPWCSDSKGWTRRDAGDRARVQPVGNGLHAAAGRTRRTAPHAHLHARLRNAVRRPSDGRRGDRACRTAGDGEGRHLRAGGEHRAGALRRVSSDGATHFAEFDLPRLPEPVAFPPMPEAVGGGARPGRRTRSASRTTASAYGRRRALRTVPVAGLEAAAKARSRQPRLVSAGAAARARWSPAALCLLPRDA